MRPYSTFLFARPSFLEGVARIFDFTGSLNQYNYSKDGAQADAVALAMDWRAIGDDLRVVIARAEPRIRARQAQLKRPQRKQIARRSHAR